MLPTASDLWSIGRGLWLAGLGLLVLLVDLFTAPGRKVAAGAIAVGGLLLTLIPASGMLAWDPRRPLLVLSAGFVSLTSYVLAGFLKANPKSNEAGIKYFLFGAAASAVMFFGFSIVYGLAGSTNLYDITVRLRTAPPPPPH